MIGIIGAMQAEVENLIGAIVGLKKERFGGFEFAVGKIGHHEVVAARCGVGKVNAAVCTQTMLLRYQPEVVINSGVAGSLSPELGILDIAVAVDAVQHDYDTTGLGEPAGALSIGGGLVTALPCDPVWRERLLNAAKSMGMRAVPVRIASGDQFITQREIKERIVKTFGASACEMEGGAVGQVCTAGGVPFAVVRAMSDSADGGAVEDYPSFAKKAAEISAKIVIRAVTLIW